MTKTDILTDNRITKNKTAVFCSKIISILNLKKSALVTFILVFSVPQILAEKLNTNSSFIIDVWQTENGLPQNSIIAMTQTRDGYLWVGTLNGLAKFDGLRFVVFDENNIPALTDSRIVYLFEDSATNLWMSSEASGVFLVKADNKITNIDIGGGNRAKRVLSMCEDASGALWFYTADGQLCRHRKGRIDVWNFDAGYSSNLRLVIPDENGGIIVATERRLSIIGSTVGLDPKELPLLHSQPFKKLDFILPSKKGGYWVIGEARIRRYRQDRIEEDLCGYYWNPLTPITAVCEDSSTNLIVGTLGEGIYILDGNRNDNSAKHAPVHISTKNGLSHNYVLSLLLDREGTLWVGTDGGGLNRVKYSTFNIIRETLGMTAQSVCEDTTNGVWFGFNAIDPLGCVVARLFNGKFQIFNITNGLINSSIRTVFWDKQNNNLLVGSWGGLFVLQGGRFQIVRGNDALMGVIQAIFQDKKGNLWVGAREGLLKYDRKNWRLYTTRDGLSSDNILSINEDSKGNIYVGTARAGLNKISENIIEKFSRKSGELPGDTVNSILIDSNDTVIVGTSGGLAIFSNRWIHITTANGLPCNNIAFVIDDKKGSLWLGSSAGLIRIAKSQFQNFLNGNAKTLYCRLYGKPDGLPTGECSFGSQPSACLTEDGKLWIPTIKGVINVFPQELKPNPFPPPVALESLWIDGEAVFTNAIRMSIPDTIVLSPKHQRLEIQFTSLNLRAPEQSRFKYKLEGLDVEWNEVGNSRFVRYNKLPVGEYRFVVTACNEDGVWNPLGVSIKIIVQPPFYRTFWFISACSILLLAAITLAVHRISTRKLQLQLERLKQKEAVEKERARIARDLHDQLGASLTQIALLGELAEADKDSPAEVESHARQITQTAREITRVLDEIVWAVNPSNDTVESLATYICKYAQEYLASAGIRFRNEIPPQMPKIQLLPEVRHNLFLATKEAITNIVRHAKATEVCLKMELKENLLTIEIYDNGIGFSGFESVAQKKRSGLINMQKRLQDIGGEFSIEKIEAGGTVVRLRTPIKSA